MTFIVRNKYHFTACAFITLLFVFSVLLRKENLSVPLSRHHEWITAHTLITCEIWDKNGGPSAYGFSPVYTYPGEGNINPRMLGGVVDKNGYVYYVSYPPFAFLFAYYATQIIGGPDVDSIRDLNLAIHFLCALLIYFLALSLAWERQKNDMSIAGIFCAFLYLFSAGNLWIHGNLYFADTLIQLFIISGLYFVVRFFKNDYAKERVILSILFFIFFLAAYTEWLGLFLAFFVGIAFLVSYFFVKEKRFLKAFFAVGVAATMALGITVWQYSSIAGWKQLKEVSTQKYTERSGHETAELSPNGFNLESDAALENLINSIDAGYKMVVNFIGLFFILFVVIALFRKTRKNLGQFQWHVTAFCLLALAILIHYYVFFNFNSLHDFSSLKTGFLLILLVLIFVSLIERMLSTNFKIILTVLIVGLSIYKGIESVEKYNADNPMSTIEWNRIETANAILEHGKPEYAIFINTRFSTELVYYSKHNVSPINDTSGIKPMLKYFKGERGQYYHHNDTKLEYILEFDKKNDEIIYREKIKFNSGNDGSGTHFQK